VRVGRCQAPEKGLAILASPFFIIHRV
jgi:hypothetical protein